MERKLLGLVLIVLVATGCQVCSNCCDYLPPVANGSYQPVGGLSGMDSARSETEYSETALSEVGDAEADAAITPLAPQ